LIKERVYDSRLEFHAQSAHAKREFGIKRLNIQAIGLIK